MKKKLFAQIVSTVSFVAVLWVPNLTNDGGKKSVPQLISVIFVQTSLKFGLHLDKYTDGS